MLIFAYNQQAHSDNYNSDNDDTSTNNSNNNRKNTDKGCCWKEKHKLMYTAHTVRHVTHTWWLRSSSGSDTGWLSLSIHRWIYSSRGWFWKGRQFILIIIINRHKTWQCCGEHYKQHCVMGKLVLITARHYFVKNSLTRKHLQAALDWLISAIQVTLAMLYWLRHQCHIVNTAIKCSIMQYLFGEQKILIKWMRDVDYG